jgi:hypothetical protein
MVLNGWTVAIAIAACAMPANQGYADATAFMGYTIMAYGIIKGCQQLDDIFNTVGAKVVNQRSGLMEDLLSIGQTVGRVGGLVAGYRGLKAGIRDDKHSGGTKAGAIAQTGVAGRHAAVDERGKPVGAVAGTMAGGIAGVGQTAAAVGTANNKGARTFMGQVKDLAKTAAEHSLVGSVAIGGRSCLQRFGNMMAEHGTAKDNATKVQTARDLAPKTQALRNANTKLSAANSALANRQNSMKAAEAAYQQAGQRSSEASKVADAENKKLQMLQSASDKANAELRSARNSGDAARIASATAAASKATADFAAQKAVAANAAADKADAGAAFAKAKAAYGAEQAAYTSDKGTLESRVAAARTEKDAAQKAVDSAVKNADKQGLASNDAVKAAVANDAGLVNGESITGMKLNKDGTFDVAYNKVNAEGVVESAGYAHSVGMASSEAIKPKSLFEQEKSGLGTIDRVERAEFAKLDSDGNNYSVKSNVGGGYGVDATVSATGKYSSDGKQFYSVKDNRDGTSVEIVGASAEAVAYAVSGASKGKNNMGAVNVSDKDIDCSTSAIPVVGAKTDDTGRPVESKLTDAIRNFADFVNSSNTKKEAKQDGRNH